MSRIDSDGTKRWYNEESQLHREDGPSVEYSDGSKSWWFTLIGGVRIH
jgi:hypothetical protein